MTNIKPLSNSTAHGDVDASADAVPATGGAVLLEPTKFDPDTVDVAAAAARKTARRFAGRHDIDFADRQSPE